MEQKPVSSWKLRLGALGLGLLALVIVYGSALKFTNDLRFVYALGAAFLFVAALWLGRNKADWLAAILLIAPLVAIFWSEVLQKVPALWPNIALWAVAVIVGMFILRTWRNQRGLALVLFVTLLAGSAWYCGWYAPRQLAGSYTRIKDESAPAFVLQPVSDGFVPLAPQRGKILVVDFFSTTCAPCIAELPHLAAVHADLADNRDIEFVVVASDLGRDTPERFRSFIESRHIDLPLAFDLGGKAHDSLGLHGVPAIVVFDREGKIRLTREGFNAAETSFRNDLVAFLKTL
ncbi:MAG TPA: redoxin domain-containing protein [Chthoniobacterales bacterium]|jgi:thiol-disulfide isomerase/thioredoxin|nr:redoxin domain-containing protein [Chthoniobacterales bacterium]